MRISITSGDSGLIGRRNLADLPDCHNRERSIFRLPQLGCFPISRLASERSRFSWDDGGPAGKQELVDIRTIGAASISGLAALGWVVIGAEVLLVDLFSLKRFAAVAVATAVMSVCSALEYLARHLAMALDQHANRMEQITGRHADVMAKQVLAVERWFGMGVRADVMARQDAADAHAADGLDSGPFRAYRN